MEILVYNFDGIDDWLFMACDTPYYVKPKGYLDSVPVPCGRCPLCKRKRINQWVFRLQEEDKYSKSSHWITLTYDTDNVPLCGENNSMMTLDKKDFRLFMKRLRRKYTVDRDWETH